MGTGIITSGYKLKVIEAIRKDIANSFNSYYMTFGKIEAWPDDLNPPLPNTSIATSIYDLNRDFIFGKKINLADTAFITRKINWVSNTVYTPYTHLDPNLSTKDFYVVTNNNLVFKCLDNNNGSPSTVQPSVNYKTGDVTTADGYVWKYMFSINALQNNKFTLNGVIPVTTDPLVSLYAENGAIHSIIVNNGGQNYLTANGLIEQVVNLNTLKISNNNSVGINGAYTKSIITSTSAYVSTNPIDFFINDYIVNSYGRYVVTNGVTGLVQGDYYRITPRVEVIGDGVGAYGYASVNATTGSISSVKVLNRGSNYTFANTIVIANTNYGTGADIYSIIPPPGGHGKNAEAELYVDTLGISIETNVSDSLPDWVSYRQTAIINNPIAVSNNSIFRDNIFYQIYTLTVVNVASLFNVGETVIGRTSGATGTVANMTTTELNLINVQGDFVQNETVASIATGLICTASLINNIDLVKNTGNVLYFKNFEPIDRAGVTSEKVKIYITV